MASPGSEDKDKKSLKLNKKVSVWSRKKEEVVVDVAQELEKLKRVHVEYVNSDNIDFQQLVNDNDPKLSSQLQEEID